MSVPKDLVVHAGQLMNIPGAKLRPDCTLRIGEGQVKEVLDGPPPLKWLGRNVEVLDLSDQYVMPGLIDCHVHSLYEVGDRPLADFVAKSDAHLALQGVYFAQKLLRSGFTTIRDVGNMQGSDAIYALRDAIASGCILGPRILGVGAFISPTGGGGDVSGLRPDVCCAIKSIGICDGPYACRAAVREQIKRGADLIKVILTGSVLSLSRSGLGVQLHADELNAIVETAHMLGRPVAVHAHGAAGVKAALMAGVDSIEHASAMDDDVIQLFSQSSTFLVPTLLAMQTVTQRADDDNYYPAPIREKARTLGRASSVNFSKAFAAGIKIAFGTDSGVFSHGQGARELALLVAAGMTPSQAIETATVRAAELLGLASSVGTLVPGSSADLIAVSGNPYDNVTVLESVNVVIARGIVAKRYSSSTMEPSASHSTSNH
jgi:imidazolonepropionase-like amidohydrolase